MDGAHHGRCILGHYTTSINFKWAPAWLGSRPRGVGAGCEIWRHYHRGQSRQKHERWGDSPSSPKNILLIDPKIVSACNNPPRPARVDGRRGRFYGSPDLPNHSG